jgi:hypothetical protein
MAAARSPPQPTSRNGVSASPWLPHTSQIREACAFAVRIVDTRGVSVEPPGTLRKGIGVTQLHSVQHDLITDVAIVGLEPVGAKHVAVGSRPVGLDPDRTTLGSLVAAVTLSPAV